MIAGLTGCGTLLTGTTQTLQINSVPSGATVQVNGKDRGQTPLQLNLRRGSAGPLVTVSLDGYEQSTFVPQTSFNPASVLNARDVPSWLIDSMTGAMYRYDPDSYNIQLNKSPANR
jgi:hypothetical protein